ncbi:MAG TPA: amidohydrolase family protein [Pseudolabrys sp.]|nr:amidohydrolase family protein [Pseudolabrys sp.]
MSDAHALGGWDVHTHVIPPAVIAAAQAGRYGMRAAPPTLHICAHGVPLHPLSEIDKLVARVVSDGLDGAVVSVPPPLFRPDLAAADHADYARLVNDSLLEACKRHHPQLRPFAYLPIENPELALRVAEQLGRDWAGTVAGTELGALSYASTRYDPLWKVLSDAKLPLFIHPGSTPDARLDAFYLNNLLGNPVETTIAAANLIFAGVMQRFPGLNVILAHGGGCVAALCGRWQQGAATKRPGIPPLQMQPREAVRRFYVDSLVHSAAFLDAIIAVIGDDRILLGSDWPFPMGAPSAEHDLGALPRALQQKIRKTNAEAAFGGRLNA